HVAGKDVEMPPQILAQRIQPTPGIERIVEHERANIDSSIDKRLHEVRPDKTIRAGHENAPARKSDRLFMKLVRHLAKVPLEKLSDGASEKICAVGRGTSERPQQSAGSPAQITTSVLCDGHLEVEPRPERSLKSRIFLSQVFPMT